MIVKTLGFVLIFVIVFVVGFYCGYLATTGNSKEIKIQRNRKYIAKQMNVNGGNN